MQSVRQLEHEEHLEILTYHYSSHRTQILMWPVTSPQNPRVSNAQPKHINHFFIFVMRKGKKLDKQEKKMFRISKIERIMRELLCEEEKRHVGIRKEERKFKRREADEKMKQIMPILQYNELKIIFQNLSNPTSVFLLSTTFADTPDHENVLDEPQGQLSLLHSNSSSPLALQTLDFFNKYLSNFLEEEKIKLFRNEKLKPFFVSDLKHDLKYFESYYEEILEKNVRRFKTGFDHDNVLKMMVCFEQNMEEIFKFQYPEYGNLNIDHIFFSNLRGNSIMKMKGTSLTKVDLNISNKEVADSKLKEEESWIGVIPSVYYTPKDCYYLIGSGKKESNKIRRLHIETNEVKEMEVRMETKRMNFSICLFNQEIFIVGGENFKEGCLSKCEKFIPSEGKVYIVSSLNQKSSQHSLCVYKNKFILKFGGTDIMESILETHSEREI